MKKKEKNRWRLKIYGWLRNEHDGQVGPWKEGRGEVSVDMKTLQRRGGDKKLNYLLLPWEWEGLAGEKRSKDIISKSDRK